MKQEDTQIKDSPFFLHNTHTQKNIPAYWRKDIKNLTVLRDDDGRFCQLCKQMVEISGNSLDGELGMLVVDAILFDVQRPPNFTHRTFNWWLRETEFLGRLFRIVEAP